jgi:hypothetical protein
MGHLFGAQAVTYGFFVCLVLLYAAGRFNTPATNRSSTVQSWYWQGLVAYLAASVMLFIVLSLILERPAVRDLLLHYGGAPDAPPGPSSDTESLLHVPAPVAATVIMTALLPSIPYLKRLDAALLGFFLRLSCIPAEVTRRAGILRMQGLCVTPADVTELTEYVHASRMPDAAAQFLRADAQSEWERSELRFTKVLLLWRRLDGLRERRRYEQFFADYREDDRTLTATMLAFAAKAANGLAGARVVRETETPDVYESLVHDQRESFRQECLDRFADVALFTARAVLQSEPSERDVRERLYAMGFGTVEAPRPFIPINQLATLCLALLAYLFVGSVVVRRLLPDGESNAWIPLILSVAYVASIGFTLWFMHRFAFARRADDGSRPVAAYMLIAALGTAIAAAILIPAMLVCVGRLPHNSFVALAPFWLLCLAVAHACDDRPPATPEPFWFHCAEAAGCALAMAACVALLYLLSPGGPLPPWLRIALPTGTAAVVGFYIPAIHRSGLRALETRRACSGHDNAAVTAGPGAAPVMAMSTR